MKNKGTSKENVIFVVVHGEFKNGFVKMYVSKKFSVTNKNKSVSVIKPVSDTVVLSGNEEVRDSSFTVNTLVGSSFLERHVYRRTHVTLLDTLMVTKDTVLEDGCTSINGSPGINRTDVDGTTYTTF